MPLIKRNAVISSHFGASDANAEGEDGTAAKVGESVPGDSVYLSNAVRADVKERVLFLPPLLVDSLVIVVIAVGSTTKCASVRGGKGG